MGNYTYGNNTYGNNAGPHAVTHAGGVSYAYDANGNNISSSDGRSLTYSTFDKVTEITTDNHKVSFAYGPNRNRYKRVDEDTITGQIKTTYYVGSVEIVVYESGANSGRMEYRRQLGNALESLVYAATNTPTPEQFTRYLLQDHLGSVDVIVNKLGEIEQELSFDAWGKRRNATDWQAQLESGYSPLDVFGGLNSITSRGYTGHEMVDSVGIIHINGRIYDPTLGRFLQADPFIQAPYNTQSLNRYSYVLNNPLNATDPSGYFFSGLISFIIVQAFYYVLPESWHSTFNAIVTLAATAICGPACGAQTAAYTSFHSTYSQTGSFGTSFRAGVKSYVISTISAEVFGRIGDSFQGDAANSLGHVGAHGFAGGVLAELQGGKFGHGFISAGVSKALTPVIEGWDGGYYGGGKDLGQAAAAVVGGTTSVITGGKFANGAITAAYANLYNAQRGAQKGQGSPGQMGRANRGNRVIDYDGFWDAVKEGGSAKLGPGAGVHLKELKAGPLKLGGGVVFGSGGARLDSEGLSVWGKSTLDVQLSLGRYGGRAYLWDIDLGSEGVNNIDVWGAAKPTWDWSVGVGGTITPYSFEVNYDFQPLIDYFGGE